MNNDNKFDQIKVELQDVMGNDRSIAEAAWTSSFDKMSKDLRTDSDVARVVNMLADSKHSVPFESVIFRFWMRIPIATDRQIMTHRIASHSGMSGRYRTMPDEFLHMPEDVLDILTNRGFFGNPDIAYYNEICQTANDHYLSFCDDMKEHRDSGKITNAEYKRIREFYRGILPQHNMTERVTIMNLRSWANFYKLRSDSHAQPEIQKVARLMYNSIVDADICPLAINALKRNNWAI